MTEAEDRLRTVEQALSDPAAYDGDLHTLAEEHARLQGQVHDLTRRWEEVALALESAA